MKFQKEHPEIPSENVQREFFLDRFVSLYNREPEEDEDVKQLVIDRYVTLNDVEDIFFLRTVWTNLSFRNMAVKVESPH